MKFLLSILVCLIAEIVRSVQILEGVEWGNQNQNIKLFYEDSGEIKEKVKLEDADWTDGTLDVSGYSISAITYSRKGRKFRAYVGNDNHIKEYVDDGTGWDDGDLYAEGEVSHASYYIGQGGLNISVFILRATGEVWQYKYSEADVGPGKNGWDNGTYLFTLP